MPMPWAIPLEDTGGDHSGISNDSGGEPLRIGADGERRRHKETFVINRRSTGFTELGGKVVEVGLHSNSMEYK